MNRYYVAGNVSAMIYAENEEDAADEFAGMVSRREVEIDSIENIEDYGEEDEEE